jgi:small-conductance mechanosensitive channel/CRP-like cAMP-binding protein
MILRPIDALIILPLALLCLLALARLARVRPAAGALVGPFAACAAAAVAMAFTGVPLAPEPAALLFLLPLLMLVVRATSLTLQWVFQRRRGTAAPALLDSVISVILYGIGLAAIAHQWFGLELTPFLATSAVVGAVVGLALQDTLGNLFAGIALHSEAPVHVGDWVRVVDRDGRVEQVSWRAMRLRTWDGDTLTVPNNEVARHSILNYTYPRAPHSRTVEIGVSYHTPPNRVISVLRQVLDQATGMPTDPPPTIRLVGYRDSSMHYEVRYYYAAYEDWRRLESEIYRLVWYHFRRHGIEIPFPVRDVLLRRAPPPHDTAETPAERLERTLREVDLFRPLSDDELRRVIARTRLLHYAAGERIIEEGSSGDSFFVIDQGQVAVAKRMGGSSRELARLVEGQFFGEMALLTGERRSATIEAVTDVDLFMIDKSAFQDILAANPTIAVDISTLLSERREALSQAEGDVTARFEPGTNKVELKNRILDRIRSYFGL